MPLVVGTDSYITLGEAETYLSTYFLRRGFQDLPEATQLDNWDELEDSVKEIHLRNACLAIEAVRFNGWKYEEDQLLAFPRSYTWGYQEAVPEAVKKAQAFEALELAVPGDDTEAFSTFTGGVEAYSLQGLGSETLRTVGPGYTGSLWTQLRSSRAKQQLIKLAGGGHAVT